MHLNTRLITRDCASEPSRHLPSEMCHINQRGDTNDNLSEVPAEGPSAPLAVVCVDIQRQVHLASMALIAPALCLPQTSPPFFLLTSEVLPDFSKNKNLTGPTWSLCGPIVASCLTGDVRALLCRGAPQGNCPAPKRHIWRSSPPLLVLLVGILLTFTAG